MPGLSQVGAGRIGEEGGINLRLGLGSAMKSLIETNDTDPCLESCLCWGVHSSLSLLLFLLSH